MMQNNDKFLDHFISATSDDQPSQEQVQQAQRRLKQKIDNHKSNRTSWTPKWMISSASAALMVVVVLVSVPFQSSLAFTDVQRYFREFSTLKTHISMQVMNEQIWTMDVLNDEYGNTRIDMHFGPGTTFILNTAQAEMLVLDHGSQNGNRINLEGKNSTQPMEQLDWLEKIKNFQGQADRLPETRWINDRETQGFELVIAQQQIQVWADIDSGLPLQTIVTSGDEQVGSFSIKADLSFDEPIDPAQFDVALPDGYLEH